MRPAESPDDLLDSAAVGKILKIDAASVRRYRHMGRLPEPDHYFGRTPTWKRSTIMEYAADLDQTANIHRKA